jgi:hypothetical protein
MQGKPQISGQAMLAFGLFSTGARIQRLCTSQIICAPVLWQGGGGFLGPLVALQARPKRTATILRSGEGEEVHAFRKVFETSRDPPFQMVRDDSAGIRGNNVHKIAD